MTTPDFLERAFEFMDRTYFLDGVCCMNEDKAAVFFAEYARNAYVAGRRAGLEEAAEVAEKEQRMYEENASRCDAAGNTMGGALDAGGALACAHVRDAIRALATEAMTRRSIE